MSLSILIHSLHIASKFSVSSVRRNTNNADQNFRSSQLCLCTCFSFTRGAVETREPRRARGEKQRPRRALDRVGAFHSRFDVFRDTLRAHFRGIQKLI